jgi:CxxC motif-containing protein (DUF1111 family)
MRPFKVLTIVLAWAAASLFVVGLNDPAQTQGPTEAPTGFSLEGNGFLEEFCDRQGELAEESDISPAIPEDECNDEAAQEEFTGPEDAAAGLGPIFNAAGCGGCHDAPILGGGSQIAEKRAGFFNSSTGVFTDHPGGSLIQDKTLATHIRFQERVNPGAAPAGSRLVTAARNTISILGSGFVEAVGNSTLQNIVNAQPSAQRGQLINVPVLEEPGQRRIGRFGHKDQQASLLSFSADAYVNEMGITSPMQRDENSSNGTPVPDDPVPGDPAVVDDEGVDVALFALFMRDTLAPPVDPVIAASQAARDGSNIFNAIGCAVCHTRNITTSAPGTVINGGGLRVARALGNKVIHPFSDFALHDLGTGDGIVQNGGASTRNKVKTTALWGLRARGRFMHDNLSLSVDDAIRRHGNQGATARDRFNALSAADKGKLLTFLNSI